MRYVYGQLLSARQGVPPPRADLIPLVILFASSASAEGHERAVVELRSHIARESQRQDR